MIFVPYPYAAEDHQTVNAQNLVNKHAGILVPDKEAMNKLVAVLIDLANDKKEQELLKENIGRLAITDADEKIAQKFLKCSMADLNNIKAVYLIGIGGIGMSALARYFKCQGKTSEWI